jgi:ribosomal protein S18 acetylase RimI-like enzyme
MPSLIIRPLTVADIPHLDRIDANFESDRFLDLEKTVDGLGAAWRLIERPLVPPFVSTDYGLHADERPALIERLRRNDGLYLVAEDDTRPAALLDVEVEHWRKAANVWHIFVDRVHRRRGVGRQLMQRALDWARASGLRGIVCETQTNNWAACNFYRKLGFHLSGIDDHFYSNQDMAVREVAVFWWYELD